MQQITQYIRNSNNPDLLNSLRELVVGTGSLTEEYKWSMPVYTLNGKDVCYLKDNKNGVNLGFTKALQLKDSSGLLEGTGKDMRHIRLTSNDELTQKQ